jgi:hypothetical protein
MKMNHYKNRYLRLLILFLSVGSLSSCIEDKGNYDYQEINSVTIAGINDAATPYAVELGGILQITPELTFSQGESEDFKYEWHVMSDLSPYNSKGILSKERNLNVVVGGLITSSGTYNLMYCVTNLTTGVRYDHVFKLLVQDKTLTGYIMLCERGNDSFDLELISLFRDTLTQYHNALDLFDSELPRTGRKPLDLLCYGDQISPSMANTTTQKKYAVWVLTDKSTDRVRVENLEYDPSFNISGIALTFDPKYRPADGNLVAEKMFSIAAQPASSGRNYMLYGGNFYFYNFSPGTWYYSAPVNKNSLTDEPYKVAPYVAQLSTMLGGILFDETNNRFVIHMADVMGNSDRVLCTQRLVDAEGDYFQWENPNYRLVYMGNRNASNCFAVVKNVSTGGYELLQFASSAKVVEGSIVNDVSKLGRADFPAGFKAEEIKHFAYSYRTNVNTLPYLYCATDDKVYKVYTNTMAVTDVTDQVLPAGHKISKLKTSNIRFARTDLLVVASYDPNGTAGQNGQLAFYEVETATGDLKLAKHPITPTSSGYQIDMKWTGFGKIINVDYKNP